MTSTSTREYLQVSDSLDTFNSSDEDFSVRWLLGLKEHPHFERNPWAREFFSTDPSFLVSRVLGLVPYPAKPVKEDTSENEEKADEQATEEESDEFSEEDDTYGLALMFGEIEPPSDDSDSSDDEAPVSTDPPVLADPEFLDLCSKLDQIFLDIE